MRYERVFQNYVEHTHGRSRRFKSCIAYSPMPDAIDPSSEIAGLPRGPIGETGRPVLRKARCL
jgi:hypothetical protein